MNEQCKYFFRVHVKLDDPESEAHLIFDFNEKVKAIVFAESAYNACDINKVWVDIVTNEETTTNSPMWR